MTLASSIQKFEDFLIKNKTILLIVSGLILFLAYTGNLPSTFTLDTQSIIGGFGAVAISIAGILVLVSIAMIAMFSDETEFLKPGLFLIPVFLVIAAVLLTVGGIGALLTDILEFIQTLPGIILTVFVGLIILTRLKFFRMFK